MAKKQFGILITIIVFAALAICSTLLYIHHEETEHPHVPIFKGDLDPDLYRLF